MSHEFRFKAKRSENQARKMVLTMALHGDHEYQFQYDLSNEERVKDFYRQHGYNFAVVVEQARTWRAGLPMVVPIFDVRKPNSFTLGGAPGSVTGIKEGGDEFIVKFEGETGHVVMSEYMDAFENAVAELERSVKLSGTDSRMYRIFLSGVSEGIASLEAYINYRARLTGGQRFRDSKQAPVSFDKKVDEWILEITGKKLYKGGVNWEHYDELRNIRNDFQAHPSSHLYGTPFPEICRRMNLFRTGIAGLLFDLHIIFNDIVPAPIIHGYYMPDIRYVVEPEYT